jgi:hypothetical protein
MCSACVAHHQAPHIHICPASRERLFYHRLIRTLILPLIATRWHAIKAELHVRATYCA